MLAMVKQCARMEEVCAQLAAQEPDRREHWQTEAEIWHQLAGRFVTQTFGDVYLPPLSNSHQCIGERCAISVQQKMMRLER